MSTNSTDITKLHNADGIIEVQLDSLDSTAGSHNFNNTDVPATTLRTLASSADTDKTHKNVFKSKIFIIAVTFSAVLITAMCIGFLVHYEVGSSVSDVDTVAYWNTDLPTEQTFWYERGIEELKLALSREPNRRRAKNVILFVGDGMGPNTVTAARIYRYKEEGLLSWERFPHMGLLKTYCVNKQVPDSFATATALFGGVKANYETGGVDASVTLANCSASLDAAHHVQTIMKWAQLDGMRTGFVTTTRVTHATPAALYAHVADRRWECEQSMKADDLSAGCKDIARQLIEDETGRAINVIMGGGRQMLVSNINGSAADPIDSWACRSLDGRDLIKDWRQQKAAAGATYAVVQNNEELDNVNSRDMDYVLGIFANGHLKYNHERDTTAAGMPSLKQMTLKAIDVLGNSEKGFLLVVESGMIDQAHHRGTARKALNEVIALEEAVNATLQRMSAQLDETLIIVTADHSHSLTINGHAAKGADILGLAGNSKTEQTPYTTLTYGTSYKGFQVDETTGQRRNPALSDTTDWDYTQQAAINTDENLHGGSDVTVHARGAMSYLFHGVHEQSYVAHVISYALRIGRFRDSSIAESLAELMPL